ncbi:hypothetical protein CHS0354_015472 [Potamilus streckersoni]|uniref:Uncharacterized protein n=1 Tax=Potamilus streckersoni TaxID=2493646 RepID=A0AAE0VHL4_9BIVA|nr:hypothetical protein CHS0354_015472 [Potamilus streckersoni]
MAKQLLALLTIFVAAQVISAFLGEMHDIMGNCRRDGGFCINVHVPPPPPQRPRTPPRRQPGNRGRGQWTGPTGQRGSGTPPGRGQWDRQAQRPGASNTQVWNVTQIPSASFTQGPSPQAPWGPRSWSQPSVQHSSWNNRGPNSRNWQPTTTVDPLSSMLNSLFSIFDTGPTPTQNGGTRVKRQAPPDPEQTQELQAEAGQRQRGQSVWDYLSQNCREYHFDFGCQREGGYCCLPFLK